MRNALIVALVGVLATACVDRPGPEASGREIYMEVCARCHGADMSGGVGPALGAGSEAAARETEFLAQAVTEGRGRMPSFRQTLSADQIDRVVDYLRDVQAGT